MTKLTLNDVSNILGNPTSAQTVINANSNLIESAIENTLSRDGTTPNQMLSDLDMNENDILNVDVLATNRLILDGEEFKGLDPNDLEMIRDVADAINDGTLSNVVSQGNVPIYATVAGMGNVQVPLGVNAIRVNGGDDAGDGLGGLAILEDNGEGVWFSSSGGVPWFRAAPELRGPFTTPHAVQVPTSFEFNSNCALYYRPNGVLTVIYSTSRYHFGDADSELRAFDTIDDGHTRTNDRFVYKIPNFEIGPYSKGDLANGRMAYVGSRRDASSSFIDPVCLYSDDGQNFTEVVIPRGTTTPTGWAALPHDRMMRLPTSAGGDDQTGFFQMFYSQTRIGVAKTLDNGASWTPIEIVLPAFGGQGLTEMTVGQVGDENKWYMIIRDEVNGIGLMSFSTNPTNSWSTPVPTPFPLNKAAPFIIEHRKNRHYLYARSARVTQTVPEYQGQLLEMEINPQEFFASSGTRGWGVWRAKIGLATWAIGYPSFAKRGDDEWVGVVNGGERPTGTNTTQGGPSCLAIITNHPSPALSLNGMRASIPGNDLSLNGDFKTWQLGKTFTGTASRQTLADGFGIRRVGSALGHFASQQVGDTSSFALRFGRIPGDTSTASINIVQGIGLPDLQSYWGKYLTVVVRAKFGADCSSPFLFLTTQASLSATTIPTTDGSISSPIEVSGVKFLPRNNGDRYEEIAYTFQVPKGSTLIVPRVYMNPTGTAGPNDWIQIDRWNVYEGPFAPVHTPPSAQESLRKCQTQIEKTTLSTDGYPGTVYGGGSLRTISVNTVAQRGFVFDWRFRQEKRITPVITTWSPRTGALGMADDYATSADFPVTVDATDRTGSQIINSGVINSGNPYRIQAIARAEMW